MMSARYIESAYWRMVPGWVYYDEKKKMWYIKEGAPERVKASFELWKKINGLDQDENGI